MGFAQKLGEFTEGVARGLGPGLEIGSRMAESKGRRAAAATRENRLASGAEKAMLWKMFDLDPSGAMAKAESLGYSELATSFRRKTQGTIGKSFASAGAGMSNVTDPSQQTDWTVDGMRKRADMLRGNVATRTAAAGNVDVTLAGVPEGIGGLVDSAPLLAQRRAFNTQTDVIRSNLTASETFLANISGINYNQEDYSTNIDEATNAYIQATGNAEAGNALRSELLKSARESQRATWLPVINSLKGDAEGLKDLLANRIILENPILSTTVASLMGKAEREQDLSPEQKRELAGFEEEAELFKTMAESVASTDPSAAEDYYARYIEIFKNNKLASPESIAILERGAKKYLASAQQKTRVEIVSSVLAAAASSYEPANVLARYGKMFGITIPPGTTVDSPIFNTLIDAMERAGAPEQDEESKQEATPVGAMLKLLNGGELDIAIKSMNEFTGDPTAPEIIRALRANGWEWSPLPVPGLFTKIEERRDTQPEPTQKPTATGRSTATGQSNEQLRQNIARQDSAIAANPGPPLASEQQLPFLPGQQRQ
jgi:hypothetical protein|tara:strand:- start:1062 stop:2693 length:1632 start_codon:yes stop_codon:yes gene_type:complete